MSSVSGYKVKRRDVVVRMYDPNNPEMSNIAKITEASNSVFDEGDTKVSSVIPAFELSKQALIFNKNGECSVYIDKLLTSAKVQYSQLNRGTLQAVSFCRTETIHDLADDLQNKNNFLVDYSPESNSPPLPYDKAHANVLYSATAPTGKPRKRLTAALGREFKRTRAEV